MKAVGVIGYKKSGKTTLVKKILTQLQKKGYQVALIKHTDHEFIDHGHHDTGQFLNKASQVAMVAGKNAEIIFNYPCSINSICSFFSADYLLFEGFKQAKIFPKILCIKHFKEKKELFDGLTLFSASMDFSAKKRGEIDYCILDQADIETITNQIEMKGFMLPDINCGKCGYQDCFSLGKAIIRGLANPRDCVHANKNISVAINNKEALLNPFLSKLFQNTICSMLSPLKNVELQNGSQVEIKIKVEK